MNKKNIWIAILLVLICLAGGIGIGYVLFNKVKDNDEKKTSTTDLYKCVGDLDGEEYYTTKPTESNCELYDVIDDCKECWLKYTINKNDLLILEAPYKNEVVFYNYKEKNEKRRVNGSFERYCQFDYGCVKQENLVYNNDELYGIILRNNGREFFISLDNYSYSYYENGGYSMFASFTGAHKGFLKKDELYREERDISNNLIIVQYSNTYPMSVYSNYYGLVNLETNEIVIPFSNEALYRTSRGNYISYSMDQDNSLSVKFYDEFGKLVFQNDPSKPNYFTDIIDVAENVLLVEKSNEFDIVNYKGETLINKKIYLKNIVNDMLLAVDDEEIKNDFNKFDIHISVPYHKDNLMVIEVEYKSFYIGYKVDLNKGKVNKITDYSEFENGL